MGIHCNYDGKILNINNPDRLRHTKIQFINTHYFFNGFCNQGCCTTYGMEVNTGNFLTGFQGFRAHSSLPNHTFKVKVTQNISLVWLFPDAGRWSSSYKTILPGIQSPNHRSAMINKATVQYWFYGPIYFQVITNWFSRLFNKSVGQPFMHCISPSYHNSG